jgi:hypothetical protein
MDNRKQQTDTPTPRDLCSLALASADEEMSPPPEELQGNQLIGRGKRAAGEEEDASSDEKIMPGAVAEAGACTGPRNRIPRHKTAEQQTDIPTPGDAPLSALASVDEVQRKGRKGRGKDQHLCQHLLLQKERLVRPSSKETGDENETDVKRRIHTRMRR